MNLNKKLLELIPKLEVTEFIGLAKLLKVALIEDKDTRRDFSAVLQDVLENFNKLSRARKKEILSLLKTATKRSDM